MKKDNEIIYVGKAKNLKKRVSSYFNREHEDNKTRELVKKVEKIEYIICNSEIDALILENNLIKKHQPNKFKGAGRRLQSRGPRMGRVTSAANTPASSSKKGIPKELGLAGRQQMNESQ